VSDLYELLDFGAGRRLEAFGPIRLDRPCPAAEGTTCAAPELWATAQARFDRTGDEAGVWTARGDLPARWTVPLGGCCFELKRTEFGHLGLFPEQTENWAWIADQVRAAGGPLRVLNLFAYTGGSTLSAAAAGAEVVHVDAARNVVAWARRNAELSGLAQASIRWIGEDALKFVRRELQRGNHYDAVILDPPSYGHGPRGEVWQLAQHLPLLLSLCRDLTAGRLRFILLTCHTPGYSPARLQAMMAETLGETGSGGIDAQPLLLCTAAGRALPSGVVVRYRKREGRS
jgi:23S rRNA (cytosine1962-C5)-methyltransferase